VPYLPVSVECVTDVPEVHYFDMTRLGSYMAVPLVYSSYYQPDAYADAKQFEQEKKEALKAAEETGGEAAAAEAEQPPEAAEEVPEKQMVLRGTPVKLVLCLDTLGTNTAIQTSKIPDLLELCKACAKCKERTESQQVDTQVLYVLEEEERQAQGDEAAKSALVAQCRSEVEAAAELQEAQEQEEQAAEEPEQKELVQEKYKYLRARQAFVQLKALVLELLSWVVVPPEVLNVIAATAFMYGYPKDKIYPKRKTMLKWDTLKTLLNDELFTTVQEANICAERTKLQPEQKLASIKEMATPAEYDEEKARALAPAFEVLYTLIQAACAYRAKDLAVRKAEYAKRKEAAAAAEEAFTETALEDLDDDFAES